ncbi:MAG TPA: sugar ABC transporter substrate-binding protein [Herpetosiphonaceae bacterium]
MYRRSSLTSLLICLSLLLAACGGTAPQTPASNATGAPAASTAPQPSASAAATAASTDGDLVAGADISKTIAEVPINNTIKDKGDITLDVWMAADYYQTAPVKAVFDAFQQAYPNVKLNVSGYEWGDMQNQVKLAVGTGTAPCVSHGHPYAMGAQGFAEDITDFWNAWQQTDKFMESGIKDVMWKERVYGVPLDINTLFTIYNKEMFKSAGVAEPTANWTFKDAREAALKMTKGDVYGTVISASGWGMSGMVVSNGTNLIKTEGKQIKANLDDPKVVEVLATISELGHKDKVSPIPPQTPRQTDAPVAIFGAEKAAFFFSGPWDLARIRKEAKPGLIDKVGTAPLPNGMTGQTDGSVLGGGSLWIPKGCKNTEVAFELLKWFTTNSYQMSMVKDQARYPVIAELYNTTYLQSDALAQPFYEQLKTAAPFALDPYADAAKAWGDAVRAGMDGGDAAQLLKEAQTKAQAAIDDAEKQ